ncbi:hypothetical protein ADEAN_000117300 [Angomonas deanei]|uniref:C3H1-type domain-containing protein n=1 Tax=Angomonas deanei TaxID=59799 RepID=A0A7G2C1X1_9TRYP|nr:hypothetical protein ADEAN_000117300 [Angomonas deanei]
MLSIDVNAVSLLDVDPKSINVLSMSSSVVGLSDTRRQTQDDPFSATDIILEDDEESEAEIPAAAVLLQSTAELFTDSEEEADPAPPRPRIPREIEKLIRPAFLSARTRPSGKELGAPEYYYEKILKSQHINDDPHYLNYSYEKYQPYQFRVRRCPAYQPSEPASCRYGRDCFYAHGAGKQRTVEANLVGGLVSVKEVRWWLKQKNGNGGKKKH